VVNSGNNTVTVIDGDSNTTTNIACPNAYNLQDVAVNPVTNKIYVPAYDSSNVTVIDGATNTTTTVTDLNASGAVAVAVNPSTNKIYVANLDSHNVTVIDGDTNAITTITDPSARSPNSVAVDQTRNKIYVANEGNPNITVIDGLTNTTYAVSNIYAWSVAVNPVTGQAFVTDNATQIFVISENRVSRIPLQVKIAPLRRNRTHNPQPTFTFTATDTFKPHNTKIDELLFQVDTWQGTWSSAKQTSSGHFQGKVRRPLQLGVHILYAYATDGQEATSTNTGQQSSPLVGNIKAYVFLVH
jgi:YVTN family beta-propeller protein